MTGMEYLLLGCFMGSLVALVVTERYIDAAMFSTIMLWLCLILDTLNMQ